MVQALSKPLTLEAFLALPETKPASEFIDGKITQKPVPQAKHSAIQGDLIPAVNQILRPNQIARAFPELRCTFGERSIVPDIAVFTWDRIQRDGNGQIINQVFLAPDWVIEILSPDQSQTKVVRNILHCLAHGTQMSWLIDPEEKLVFIYFPNQPIAIFEPNLEPSPESAQYLPVPNFAQAFQLTTPQLFDYLNG